MNATAVARLQMRMVQQGMGDGVADALRSAGVEVEKAEYRCGKLSTFHDLKRDADRAMMLLYKSGWRNVRELDTYEGTYIVTATV